MQIDRGRFRRLPQRAAKWREAELLRAFLKALGERLPAETEPIGGLEISAWLAWARRKVETHDPLSNDRMSILRSLASVTPTSDRN